MTTNLFEDFDPYPSSNGNKKIQFELKGADYNDTFIWNSPEDIKVKPFYHSDDFTATFEVNTKPINLKFVKTSLYLM
jgi:methylmalonyl-CoA mutase